MRIAGSVSGIIKPVSEALPLMMKMMTDPASCKVNDFLDCGMKLPIWERRGPELFTSKCAIDNGCKPEISPTQLQRREVE